MKPAAVLCGLCAALGLCIALGAGVGPRFMGIGVMLLGIGSAVLCCVAICRQKKSIFRLQRQLEDFLEGKMASPAFSVDDDDFALFENTVVELETRLLLEQENTRKTIRHNADFIADVSHQLKTPLAGLKLYCELGGIADDGRTAKLLALIEHMENLIATLLRLEKLRADAYEMKFHPTSLSGIICEVREQLLCIYPAKVITIQGNARLRCDVDWMGEALSNIMKNACEHTTDNGKIAIAIDSSDASVSIAIEDDGGGVAQETLAGLFERFSRNVTPAKPGSTGLGLSIARTIVEKHHGTAFAENGPLGLRVILCFPILDGLQPL